jgi:hypothetical protein
MTQTEIFTILKTWISNVLNTPTSIGNCNFTNGSKIITGTNFITNGIIQNGGFVKVTSHNLDFYSKIESFTNTQITLVNEYLGATSTNVLSDYISSFIPIVRGEQSASYPKKEFIVLHQPISCIQINSSTWNKTRVVITGTAPNQIKQGFIDYVNHWQGTVSIEEFGFKDNGDKLRQLIGSLERPDIKNYFVSSKLSILRNEGINPIPQLSGNTWELRSNVDLIILFPDEGTYESGYIESVEVTRI